MSDGLQQQIELAAALLRKERRGVVLTGAGISVPSGIPDFRSGGGLWSRFNPMEYATIEAFRSDPRKVWQMIAALHEIVGGAQPNAGHRALAQLEEAGLVVGIVTQNIDNLHQRAGSRRVVEFHGNGQRLLCLKCQRRSAAPGRVESPPLCERCGEVLKPDVVLFGELIPQDALDGARELMEACRVLLVVGTSATVSPAAELPHAALAKGAAMVECNLERTTLSSLCLMSLRGDAAEVLPELARLAL